MQLTSLVIAGFLALSLILTNCATNILAEENSTLNSSNQGQLLQRKIASKEAQLLNKIERKAERVENRLASKEAQIEERFEMRRENIQELIANRKEKMATRAAALKQKLATFKDKKKASAAANINEHLNKINDRKTTQLMKHLEQMKELLSRLEEKIAQFTADSANIQTSISKAKTDIATAEAAIKTQSEKDYTLTLTTENKLKVDAQAMRDSLHTDLKTVHNLVVTARQSVAVAISTTVSTIKGNTNGE